MQRFSPFPLIAAMVLGVAVAGCGVSFSVMHPAVTASSAPPPGIETMEPFHLTGHVFLPQRPLNGATITLWALGDQVHTVPIGTAVTDADGSFDLSLSQPLDPGVPLILTATAEDIELYTLGRAGILQTAPNTQGRDITIDLASSIVAKAIGPALAALAVSTTSHPAWPTLTDQVDALVTTTRQDLQSPPPDVRLQASLSAFRDMPTTETLHQAAVAVVTYDRVAGAMSEVISDVQQAIRTAPAYGGKALAGTQLVFGPIAVTLSAGGALDASGQINLTNHVLKNTQSGQSSSPAASGGGGSSAAPADEPLVSGQVH